MNARSTGEGAAASSPARDGIRVEWWTDAGDASGYTVAKPGSIVWHRLKDQPAGSTVNVNGTTYERLP